MALPPNPTQEDDMAVCVVARSHKAIDARRWFAIILTSTLALCVASKSSSQSRVAGAAPQFEVASVKPSAEPTSEFSIAGGPGTTNPGTLVCRNTPLSALVRYSFDLKLYQLVGPPSMTGSRYDILAKIPAGATRDQVKSMLLNLLKDRLSLVLHRETRQLPAYELVVLKGGHKLKKSPSLPVGSSAGPCQSQRGLPKDKDGFAIEPPGVSCYLSYPEGGRGSRYIVRRQPLNGLFLTVLGVAVDRPVVDKTGLTGEYDFNMFYSYGPPRSSGDFAASSSHAPGDGATESDDLPAPDLFVALEQQLGLRLRSAKTPVEVVVVDSFNKAPTAN
jgi:uncharacterized protein (TIGR03435 family)